MKDLIGKAPENCCQKENLNDPPLLVVLVGESGVGKSTFCETLDCKNNWYVSSDPIIKLVQKKGLPVNHDTIHASACEAYDINPEWQVPLILDAMNGKNFLLLDGPRRFKEVKALKEQYSRTLVVRIIASDQDRFARLKIRDGIDKEEFQQILWDETQQTELMQILSLADLIIENNGTLEQIQAEASNFKEFLHKNEKNINTQL